ncbi:hypothetical protein HPB48_012844 [Haemaphysalis longicornis]|uniref:Uncharacterized protein n=1 Tax=Haemaphysalis longicornis TaxID=44386 RepID=A0A9J6FPG6_HAELO|nr:hypothetical protein HPB48_012844 [Haemaphysalis longicornis]
MLQTDPTELEKRDALEPVRNLVVSRVTYSLPYHGMYISEEQQANTYIRKTYKTALRLPLYTLAETLLAVGDHNTLREVS